MIESLGRSLLYKFSAERAHDLSLKLLSGPLSRLVCQKQIQKPVEIMGLKFPNFVGLAAGYDKDAVAANGLNRLGFGFLEFGTVTPRPQPGNPKPRLFRLPNNQAIINRMGFNNLGVDHLLEKLQSLKLDSIVGINIGKNKETPNESAFDDYAHCLMKVFMQADYVTVNISSPNTKDLRKLQEGQQFVDFLNQLKVLQNKLESKHKKRTPLVIKIAPDQNEEACKQMALSIKDSGMDGIICTNTTISREDLISESHTDETGGLSGQPLLAKSNQVLKWVREAVGKEFPIIGVGGILTAEDALSKMKCGADLVQIYTGLIYKGPRLIQDINKAIRI